MIYILSFFDKMLFFFFRGEREWYLFNYVKYVYIEINYVIFFMRFYVYLLV